MLLARNFACKDTLRLRAKAWNELHRANRTYQKVGLAVFTVAKADFKSKPTRRQA